MNKRKQREIKRKARKVQVGATLKARDMLGVGPITQEEVNIKNRQEISYEEAKLQAGNDFLMNTKSGS